MNALATTSDITAANVIMVDFGASPAVETDFAAAATPKSELALKLYAEAQLQIEVAEGKKADGKKAGWLAFLATNRTDVFLVPPYLLKIKAGWNKRVASDPANLEHVDNLARSIAVKGVEQPLTVYLEGSDVFVSDGHCRLLAVFRAIEVYGAEIKAIPVKQQKYTNDADRVLNQIVLNSGKPLTILEMGAVMVELTGFGWTSQQIADKIGSISRIRVDQILKLYAESTDGIKSMIATGSVTATTAAAVLRDAGGDGRLAEQTLIESVVVANKRGKTTATAKDIAVVKAARTGDTVARGLNKDDIRGILANKATAEVAGRVATVTLSAADWRRIKEWFKID